MIHPARTIPYDDLVAGLDEARVNGFVYRRVDPDTGLALYVYSSRCVFEDGWDEFSMLARGLIIDHVGRRVIATPFPKFFNLGEKHGEAPDLPFEAFEKLDGSLIIVFHHEGKWRCATKGAFDSEQAKWAQARLDAMEQQIDYLCQGTTYLFEAVYPGNRIVIRYPEPALVTLAAYGEDGHEVSYEALQAISGIHLWPIAKRHAFASIAEMVSRTATLPRDDEGYVVRFSNGLRLKIKGAEYRRIHALISRCTPIAMWEAIAARDDMQAIRRDMPEEFWQDFDDIVRLLTDGIDRIESKIAAVAASVAHLSDKELGLSLNDLDPEARPYVFGFRKAGAIVGRQREGMLKLVRPTGNLLPGYKPSYAMNRVVEEMMS